MTTKEKVQVFIKSLKRRTTFTREELLNNINANKATCMRALRHLRNENKINYEFNLKKNYYKLIK